MRPARLSRLVRVAGLLVPFLGAWFALDRLGVSPPLPGPAVMALGVALLVLAAGELLFHDARSRSLVARLGYGRPDTAGLVLAGLVGAAVVLVYLAGAAALGIDLELRAGWPRVLVGALVYHGLAEETVWRGFVFRRLREGRSFRRAVVLSIPLIALTHLPIVATSGWLVGGLATLTAAVTCVPFAYLWERGGRTIWAPALVHGLVGTWQLFERTYPVSFSIMVMLVTILVPLLAFPLGGRLAVRR